MGYAPTTWVNGETPINADNLNNMEQGILILDRMLENGASSVPYDNTTSGLASDNVKDALDEITGNFTGAANALGTVLVAYGVEVPAGTSLLSMIETVDGILNPPIINYVPLIPVLSANSDSAFATFNSTASSTLRYKAFDGDDGTWTIAPQGTTTVEQYIGYDFGEEVELRKVDITCANYGSKSATWNMKLQYTTGDGVWTDCSDEVGITLSSTTPSKHEILCTAPVKCTSFRIYFTGGYQYLNNATGGHVFRIHTIQAYTAE